MNSVLSVGNLLLLGWGRQVEHHDHDRQIEKVFGDVLAHQGYLYGELCLSFPLEVFSNFSLPSNLLNLFCSS